MSTSDQIATRIVREQESLMGSVAWSQAGKVRGLRVDKEASNVLIDNGSDGRVVIDELVQRYGKLFGKAARQVCKEAVAALTAELGSSELPSSLK